MTPGARVQAAIEVLDRIAAGEAAEAALTRWARSARYAGSSDRAAVRDHVFGALRRWWSSAALGGGESGRARMIGVLRDEGGDPAALFTGIGHAPRPLSDTERAAPRGPDPQAGLDAPPWLLPELGRSLDADRDAALLALRQRAAVFLRVNIARASREEAIRALAEDGVACLPHPLSCGALEVVANSRRVHRSAAYRAGLVELQDAASQAVVDLLPLDGCRRILDYCAGGGGKTLAMAARHAATYHAHDVDAARLRDLPKRAARADVEIRLHTAETLSNEPPYDLVLVDAPCSGSGAWRRSPEAKIRLTPERLQLLKDAQARILDQAISHVALGGRLAYATCSLLLAENADQAGAFARRAAVVLEAERSFSPLDGGDGFYCAIFRRC